MSQTVAPATVETAASLGAIHYRRSRATGSDGAPDASDLMMAQFPGPRCVYQPVAVDLARCT